NAQRACLPIGVRRERSASSSSVGGGSRWSIQTESSSPGTNSPPVQKGIQSSLKPKERRARPTSLTAPLATMNEQDNPAKRSSDARRPSRKPTTSPQIIPRQRPLVKR